MHVEWYHLGLGSTGCRHGRSLFESPMHFRVVSPSSLLANSPHVQSHVHFPCHCVLLHVTIARVAKFCPKTILPLHDLKVVS